MLSYIHTAYTRAHAFTRYQRTHHDLRKHTRMMQVWWVKCRALTNQSWLDDTEIEEDTVADVLMDDNAIAALPRPGTSLNRPQTGTNGPSPAVM